MRVLHGHRCGFATVLTLVVTPSALMVFTRDKRPEGHRSLLSRLFRRGKGGTVDTTKDADSKPAIANDEGVAYPKAAE